MRSFGLDKWLAPSEQSIPPPRIRLHEIFQRPFLLFARRERVKQAIFARETRKINRFMNFTYKIVTFTHFGA